MPNTHWRVAIHGGAGVDLRVDYAPVRAHLLAVVREAGAALKRGESALDVVEQAVRQLEESGLYVAGKGSAPNSAGVVELDASLMDGASRRAGAVCAVANLESPIAAARAVLDHSPHVLLAGDGAIAFAAEHGVRQIADPAGYYTGAIGIDEKQATGGEVLSHGTVGAVALDRAGRLAAATSTGGLLGKRAGRVGDTPLPGIGTWADKQVAISCTGIGEAFILSGGALGIAHRMAFAGSSIDAAGRAVLDDVESLGGDGGYIALTAAGQFSLGYNSPGLKFAVMADNSDAVSGISQQEFDAALATMDEGR